MTEDDIPNIQIFNNLKGIVDRVVDRSKYNKVDLNSLFSFMDQWFGTHIATQINVAQSVHDLL